MSSAQLILFSDTSMTNIDMLTKQNSQKQNTKEAKSTVLNKEKNTGNEEPTNTPKVSNNDNLLTFDQQRYQFLTDYWQQIQPTIPLLTPDKDTWDIEGDPAIAQGYVFYLSSENQALLQPILDNPHQAFKVVNPDEPAVKLTYYTKHHYFVRKPEDITQHEKQELLTMYISRLRQKVTVLFHKAKKAKKNQSSPLYQPSSALTPKPQTSSLVEELAFYQNELQTWEKIQERQEEYELILTNYNRGYRYTYVNYKYRIDAINEREETDSSQSTHQSDAIQPNKYANKQVQLLKHQQDKEEWILEHRYNFIIVDAEAILKKHDHQHKIIEAYITNFPIASDISLTKAGQLRVRPILPPSKT